MEITRDFTVAVFIVNNGKVLLHKHKKLEKWLPLGGHIDNDELPQECAIREVKEESGLNIKLVDCGENLSEVGSMNLVQPYAVLCHDITKHHQHINFEFFARLASGGIAPAAGESEEIKWFALPDVLKLDTYANVRALAKKALEMLK
jgi:8-oxo-dGTP pyrophosphatase MutT (NUDIX family)